MVAQGYRVPQEKFTNPWCMRKGYGSRSVSLSVTTLAATYLVCESNLQCYKVPYGLPNAWFVWILPKTLYSPVLASFNFETETAT